MPLRFELYLHLCLQLLQQLLQPVFTHVLLRPRNPQPFLRIRFRDHVYVHVVDFLMCDPAVVLEDVVGCRPARFGDSLRDGQEFLE